MGVTLASLGEARLLEELVTIAGTGRGVAVPPGDDGAVVRLGRARIVLTTDALVEGVHFRREWDSAAGLGRRAFSVSASDVGAMGGRARFALVSIAFPASTLASDARAFHRGFRDQAKRAGCSVVGGNTSAAPAWSIHVSVVGEIRGAILRRSGARRGDDLWLTGTLGGAAMARDGLLGLGPKCPPRAFLRPSPPLDLGEALGRRALASSAIDLSDGLAIDLERLCGASELGAIVDTERIPIPPALRRAVPETRLRLALAGGEDYQLLFTAPVSKRDSVERLGRDLARCPRLTRIGATTSAKGVVFRDEAGSSISLDRLGFDHFADR